MAPEQVGENGTIRSMSQQLLLVGNWKSYITSTEGAIHLVKTLDKKLPKKLKSKIVLVPAAPLVALVRYVYGGKRMSVGMQDVTQHEEGASTGSVTAAGVVGSGATYCIVGHSERRKDGETNVDVARKIRLLLDAKVTPIVCIGELERDRDGNFYNILEHDVAECLARILPQEVSKVVIAYEPVWAIGASAAPASRVVSEALVFIRKTIASQFGREIALKMKMLYGGSVSPSNAHELLHLGHVNGFLIGRASADADQFIGIIKACQ